MPWFLVSVASKRNVRTVRVFSVAATIASAGSTGSRSEVQTRPQWINTSTFGVLYWPTLRCVGATLTCCRRVAVSIVDCSAGPLLVDRM